VKIFFLSLLFFFRHGSIDNDRSIAQRLHDSKLILQTTKWTSCLPLLSSPPSRMALWNETLLVILGLIGTIWGWVAWDKWCYEAWHEDSLDKSLPEATRNNCRERCRKAKDQRKKGLRSYLLWTLSCSVPGSVLSTYHWTSSGLQSLLCCVVSSACLLWESISRSGGRRNDGQANAAKDNNLEADRGSAVPRRRLSREETPLLPTRIPAPRYEVAGVVRQRFASNNSTQAATGV
jgi:hypothetical protein